MIAKISMTAAFLLMVAPPIAARASSRVDSNPALMTGRAHQLPLNMVLAQDQNGQPSMGTTDSDNDNSNDNDNDSNDSADDNQNADSDQTDQNADDSPTIPPTVLGQPEGEQAEPRQAPPMNAYPQPVNPYQ